MNKLIGLVFIIFLACISYFFINLSLPTSDKVIVQIPNTDMHRLAPTPIPLSAEKLTALVNNWRVSQGFQPYIQNENLCNIANNRISVFPHDHADFYKQYSNYPSVISENITWDYPTETSALNGWLHSPEHLNNLEKNYTYSCIVCKLQECIEIFSNLENGTR